MPRPSTNYSRGKKPSDTVIMDGTRPMVNETLETCTEKRERILNAKDSPGHDIKVECIPEALISCNRWINWRWKQNSKGRWTKVPTHPIGGYDIDGNSLSNWRTFSSAADVAEAKGLGFGIAFNNDGLIAADVDKCRNPDTGEISPWAIPVIQSLNSYTEVTPTRTGLRIVFYGKLPELATKKFDMPDGGEIEFFNKVKFCTVTGQHVPGTPNSVQDRQDALDKVYSELTSARAETKSAPQERAGASFTTPTPSDDWETGLAAVAVVPNSPGVDYDTWLAIGMALHSVDASGGLEVWIDWSKQSDKYVPGECERKWKSFTKGGITIATLCKLADDIAGKDWRPRRSRPSAPSSISDGDAPADKAPSKVLFEIDDPRRLAVLYNSQNCTAKRQPLHVRWNGNFLRFERDRYTLIEDEVMRADLTNFVQREFERHAAEQLERHDNEPVGDDGKPKPAPRAKKVKGALVNDVVQHMAAVSLIPGYTPQPSWLRNKPMGFDPRETIVAKNGIINLRKLVSGDPCYLLPHTPDYFSTNCLPFEFNESAPEPVQWLRFLRDLWPNDPESIQCLQEWMGLFLVSDTRAQKILLIVGPRRSGKGTIGRIIRALIGESNVAGPTLAGLATNFGLWPLLGKQVAIISDARLSSKTDVAIVAERLLSISGEDGITIDRKNLPPVTTTLWTRFVLMTNELLRLTDASNALAGRFVILRMTNSFFGQEDHGLTERLMSELPSILTWAIAGWQRLTENGRFTIPESSQDLVTQMEDSASPVGAFVRECCDLGMTNEVDKSELFNAWREWCASEGQTHPGISAQFAINLRAVVPNLDSKRGQVMGVRVNQYTGIKLKSF